MKILYYNLDYWLISCSIGMNSARPTSYTSVFSRRFAKRIDIKPAITDPVTLELSFEHIFSNIDDSSLTVRGAIFIPNFRQRLHTTVWSRCSPSRGSPECTTSGNKFASLSSGRTTHDVASVLAEKKKMSTREQKSRVKTRRGRKGKASSRQSLYTITSACVRILTPHCLFFGHSRILRKATRNRAIPALLVGQGETHPAGQAAERAPIASGDQCERLVGVQHGIYQPVSR